CCATSSTASPSGRRERQPRRPGRDATWSLPFGARLATRLLDMSPDQVATWSLPLVVKKRLDVLLVERGLAESRTQAQALVMAGRVPGHSKPGEQVDETTHLEIEQPPPYVSRAGHKLANALDAFGIDVAGLDALDVGASTGGFTDVLLQRGVARVIALDVGYGQLHDKIRRDPRVTVMERVNARSLTELPFAPQLVTCDVSFISVKLALPPALGLAAPGWQALVLVKPQFEAGRAETPKGVVRDPAVRRRVV